MRTGVHFHGEKLPICLQEGGGLAVDGNVPAGQIGRTEDHQPAAAHLGFDAAVFQLEMREAEGIRRGGTLSRRGGTVKDEERFANSRPTAGVQLLQPGRGHAFELVRRPGPGGVFRALPNLHARTASEAKLLVGMNRLGSDVVAGAEQGLHLGAPVVASAVNADGKAAVHLFESVPVSEALGPDGVIDGDAEGRFRPLLAEEAGDVVVAIELFEIEEAHLAVGIAAGGIGAEFGEDEQGDGEKAHLGGGHAERQTEGDREKGRLGETGLDGDLGGVEGVQNGEKGEGGGAEFKQAGTPTAIRAAEEEGLQALCGENKQGEVDAEDQHRRVAELIEEGKAGVEESVEDGVLTKGEQEG